MAGDLSKVTWLISKLTIKLKLRGFVLLAKVTFF